MMKNENKTDRIMLLFLLSAALVWVLAVTSCDRSGNQMVRQMTGGDPERGRAAIQKQGCATCHTIPGIRGAVGLVGPPLERVSSRVYLAGRIQNTPENMTRWIRFPKQVDPETAMPQMNIPEQEGRDITAYLYTLR